MKKWIVIFAVCLLLFSCSSDTSSMRKRKSASKVMVRNMDEAGPSEQKTVLNAHTPVLPINSPFSLTFSPIDVSNYSPAEVKRLYAHLLIADQQYRDSLRGRRFRPIFFKDVWRADSLNQLLLSALVDKFGWPTVKKYGSKSVETAFLITWHALDDYKKQQLPILEAATKLDTLNYHYYKVIKDRLLLDEAKPQQFNTHHRLPDGKYHIDFLGDTLE